MEQQTIITDREGDTLRADGQGDTLFLEAITADNDPILALDRAGVEKLRDACNAFLAAQQQPARQKSGEAPTWQGPPSTGCTRGPNGYHAWVFGVPYTCTFCSETWTEEDTTP